MIAERTVMLFITEVWPKLCLIILNEINLTNIHNHTEGNIINTWLKRYCKTLYTQYFLNTIKCLNTRINRKMVLSTEKHKGTKTGQDIVSLPKGIKLDWQKQSTKIHLILSEISKDIISVSKGTNKTVLIPSLFHKYENTHSRQLPAPVSIKLIVFALHSSNLKPCVIWEFV